MYVCIKASTIYECNECYLANAIRKDAYTFPLTFRYYFGYNLAILHLKAAIISGILRTIGI